MIGKGQARYTFTGAAQIAFTAALTWLPAELHQCPLELLRS